MEAAETPSVTSNRTAREVPDTMIAPSSSSAVAVGGNTHAQIESMDESTLGNLIPSNGQRRPQHDGNPRYTDNSDPTQGQKPRNRGCSVGENLRNTNPGDGLSVLRLNTKRDWWNTFPSSH